MTNDFDTEDFVRSKTPGEIRISKRVASSVPQRYATMRVADGDAYDLAVEKGELVLRETPSGTRQIKVRFFETSRRVVVMTLQRWNDKTNKSSGACSFPLVGPEISALLAFIQDIQKVRLPSGRVVVEQGALEHPQFTDESLLQVMRGKSELMRAILRSEATLGDVKA